jgi:hypothetical protein
MDSRDFCELPKQLPFPWKGMRSGPPEQSEELISVVYEDGGNSFGVDVGYWCLEVLSFPLLWL